MEEGHEILVVEVAGHPLDPNRVVAPCLRRKVLQARDELVPDLPSKMPTQWGGRRRKEEEGTRWLSSGPRNALLSSMKASVTSTMSTVAKAGRRESLATRPMPEPQSRATAPPTPSVWRRRMKWAESRASAAESSEKPPSMPETEGDCEAQ